jgi:hypothetical protein
MVRLAPWLNRDCGHFFTLYSAAFALIGAFLAMIVIMLSTFLGAVATDLGAYFANIARVGRIGRHQERGCSTEDGAVSVQSYATDHHQDVLLAKAFSRAMGAFVGAMIAGFDAIDKSFMWHRFLSSFLFDQRA